MKAHQMNKYKEIPINPETPVVLEIAPFTKNVGQLGNLIVILKMQVLGHLKPFLENSSKIDKWTKKAFYMLLQDQLVTF